MAVQCAQGEWVAYVIDEGALIAWNGTAWADALSMLTSLQNLVLLGVGTSADTTNPFSAKLNNALWVAKTVAEGGTGDLRYKMSKAAVSNTLSLLLQDNFSGRAEIGLTGDDSFHVKVSADGSSWLEAILIDKSTGKLTLGQGFTDSAGARAQLYAAPFDALAHCGMQVNGSADVSQELGSTGATLASGTTKYTADCWEAQYVHGANTAVITSAQLAAASFPSALPGYSFGHQVKATTALSSPANADYALHRQQVEGYRVAHLGWGTAGAQPLAYAFQFCSTVSGTAFVKVSNSTKARCYYQEFAVAAGWNFVTGTVAGDTSGTWQAGTSAGLIFEIFSAGKAASPTAPGAWGSTNTTQTTNSTNLLGTNNNQTIVTGLMVLPGVDLPSSARAPPIMRPFDNELFLAKRYYQKSYDYAAAPGSNTLVGAFDMQVPSAGTGSMLGFVFFRPQMRTTPSMTTWDAAQASGKVFKGANGRTAAVADSGPGIDGVCIGTSDATSAAQLFFHWVADARM